LIEHLTISLEPVDQLATPQKRIMSVHVLRAAIEDQGFFPRAQRDLQRSDDVLRDVVLHLENVSEVTVVALGPEMSTAPPVDQLGSDANPIAGLSNTAFECECPADGDRLRATPAGFTHGQVDRFLHCHRTFGLGYSDCAFLLCRFPGFGWRFVHFCRYCPNP
jgi:hypothetical protein